MYCCKGFCNLVLAIILAAAAHAADPAGAWQSSEDGAHKLSETQALEFSHDRPGQGHQINLDPARRYQSILGMGGSLEHATCYNLSKLSDEKRAEVIQSLVDPVTGIGMNLMRLCIGTSDFVGEPYYSYNDLPPGETDLALEKFSIEKDRAYVLPAVKLAQEKNPDLLFFASPWSPPGWMKTNGNLAGGKVRPEFYDVYARYLIKFLDAYAAEGIPVHAITLQNEPQHIDPDYTTTLWTGEEQRDFIRANMGPLLSASGLPAQIWCWDHNWNQPEFPRAVLSSPEAAKYVQGIAWHFYEGRVEMQSRLKEEFPDKDCYFTEGSTFGTHGAVRIIEILRHWARSYSAWVLMLDEHRKPNNGPHHASATPIELKDTGEVEYRFDYYMYGQFMKYIPRGAVRIESGPLAAKGPAQIAFETPDGRIVLVVANAQRETLPFSVSFKGKHAHAKIGPRTVATYLWPAT